MPKAKPSARTATLEDLVHKPVRTKELTLPIGEDDAVTLKLRAINTVVYDKLIAEHPPTKEQKAEGSHYNLDTFGPVLLATCTLEPAMTAEDAVALWNSEDWSRGELLDWFMGCMELCNAGMKVPFTANGSE